MNSISFKTIIEDVPTKLLSTLSKQQIIIGAIALALFAFIAVGCYYWQKSKKLSACLIPESKKIPTPTEPRAADSSLIQTPVLNLVGIPNLGATCFINSAVMSLFPLRKYLDHLNSPVLKIIKETYDNPPLLATRLVSVLREFYQKKNGNHSAAGDSRILIAMLLEEIVKEDPKLKSLFCGSLRSFKCDTCTRKESEREILKFYPTSKVSFSLDNYLKCACRDICGSLEDLSLPKYCLIDLSHLSDMSLKEDFEWRATKFKVIAAVKGGTGHASCVIKKEDGNWYLFDDSKVSPINPFNQAGYIYMILEKIEL